MQTKDKKVTEWLAPLPEEEYLRILYIGKLQTKKGDDKENADSSNDIEEMINEIWNKSRVWNKNFGISGHLSYTNDYHVAQLIEGKVETVNSLMANIEKDPRVLIWKTFRRTLPTMNVGWNISMCYSFQITTEQWQLVSDYKVTPEQMFNNMKNTYEVRREGWELCKFYKTMVETFLLKFMAINGKI